MHYSAVFKFLSIPSYLVTAHSSRMAKFVLMFDMREFKFKVNYHLLPEFVLPSFKALPQ